MITGNVSSIPKNVYLRCDGKGFNSSLGGFSFEDNALSLIGGNGSNLGAHPDSCHSRVIRNQQNLYPKFLLLL